MLNVVKMANGLTMVKIENGLTEGDSSGTTNSLTLRKKLEWMNGLTVVDTVDCADCMTKRLAAADN